MDNHISNRCKFKDIHTGCLFPDCTCPDRDVLVEDFKEYLLWISGRPLDSFDKAELVHLAFRYVREMLLKSYALD